MKQLGFFKFVLIGLGVVAVIIAFSLLANRGARARLTGSILKVRLIPTDTNSAVALIDFRFQNPAEVPFVVRDVQVVVIDADGATVEGDRVAQMDLDRVLEYNKLAGPRYNPMLMARDRANPGESFDRTAAGSFALSEQQLERRKRFVLRIGDVDGATTEIEETAR